jgi:hypothetical protein
VVPICPSMANQRQEPILSIVLRRRFGTFNIPRATSGGSFAIFVHALADTDAL